MSKSVTPDVVPDCINCSSVGLVTPACMAFELPTPEGELFIPLCTRHFELLRTELNEVHDHQNPRPVIIKAPRDLRMN